LCAIDDARISKPYDLFVVIYLDLRSGNDEATVPRDEALRLCFNGVPNRIVDTVPLFRISFPEQRIDFATDIVTHFDQRRPGV